MYRRSKKCLPTILSNISFKYFWIMKRYSLLFILLVVFPLFSCRGNRQDVSKRLSSAAGLMLEKPDSALSVIKKIDTLSLRTPYLKAEYSLLLATALDKNRIDTIDIRVIEPAITFFRNRKHPAKYQRALYYQVEYIRMQRIWPHRRYR